jgi:predicted phage terminase large subunit-like protein
MGFNLMCFDDMLEGREEAESAIERDNTYSFIKVDAIPCLEPDGSRLLNGTRWHDDDPIGRAVSEGWDEINIPALDECGNSYWPKRWPTAKLLERQAELGGPEGYDWCSVYMGRPRAKGERLFQDARFAVNGLPVGPVRVGIGVDFAYTAKKKSDYSCAVVMAEVWGVYYILHVYREKVPEAEFRAKVAELQQLYQAQFVVGYVAKVERANVDLLLRDGLPAFAADAVQDKKIHALPTIAAWNIGQILLLPGKSWERDFVREVSWFTGLGDTKDDQVDAMCTVYDALRQLPAIDWDWVNSVQGALPESLPLLLG